MSFNPDPSKPAFPPMPENTPIPGMPPHQVIRLVSGMHNSYLQMEDAMNAVIHYDAQAARTRTFREVLVDVQRLCNAINTCAAALIAEEELHRKVQGYDERP